MAGLKNNKRPLIFTSGSWIRVSENYHFLVQQDKYIVFVVLVFFCEEKCKN